MQMLGAQRPALFDIPLSVLAHPHSLKPNPHNRCDARATCSGEPAPFACRPFVAFGRLAARRPTVAPSASPSTEPVPSSSASVELSKDDEVRYGVSLQQGPRETMEDVVDVVEKAHCGYFFAGEPPLHHR
jgi:hypothetical protein